MMLTSSVFVLLAVLLPFTSLLLALRRSWRHGYRYCLPLLPLPALLLALLSEPGWWLTLPELLYSGQWGMDELRRAFLLSTALLWIASGVMAVGYLQDLHLRRFCVFWALTLTGNLGLTLAIDVASFYSFFVLMTFAAYGLVVHEGSAAANRAGRIYLAMAVVGEMAILVGLLLAAHAADSTLLNDLPGAIPAAERPWLILLLLLSGFGVKAGLPLLHFWLPLAHPVAPTPASAVLSGAMIKAGLLGWLLTLPIGQVSLPAWGNALVALGALGALGGAALGLRQQQPKAVLAYSSISQMGLITLLVGAALANAAHASTLLAVIALYALHHALAKGSLFLSTAMALPAARAPRWLMVLLIALPGLSLAGLPFTSGAMAKLAMKGQLKPANFDFALAPCLPALLSAGAIATTALVWRFLWTQLNVAKIAVNPAALWLGWGLATSASLALFWALPKHQQLPAQPWLVNMASDAGSLLWPIAVATLLAGLLLYLSKQRALRRP